MGGCVNLTKNVCAGLIGVLTFVPGWPEQAQADLPCFFSIEVPDQHVARRLRGGGRVRTKRTYALRDAQHGALNAPGVPISSASFA